MVKYLVLIIIFLFGCEINSTQIIKPEKFRYETAKFDTVSKILNNEFKTNSPDHQLMSEIIQYWFDNRIKTDGFDGNLSVNVKQIQINREKKRDYYKFSISLSLEFLEQKSSTNVKSYNINSSEYGEIVGSFSIKDQDNLDINLISKHFESA